MEKDFILVHSIMCLGKHHGMGNVWQSEPFSS